VCDSGWTKPSGENVEKGKKGPTRKSNRKTEVGNGERGEGLTKTQKRGQRREEKGEAVWGKSLNQKKKEERQDKSQKMGEKPENNGRRLDGKK